MSDTYDLSGKTAIVTGASSGIGRAIAEKLGAAKAHVFLCGRNQSAMQESSTRIESLGGRANIVVADVRDPSAVFSLVDKAIEASGQLHIMVNNAGISHPESIMDGTPEQWRAMLETNVLGLLAGCQAAVKAMRACNAEGHVVNISSLAARMPEASVYGATKHMVSTLSGALRKELEEDSIRVVNIEPGGTATNFIRHFPPDAVTDFFKKAGVDIEFKSGDLLSQHEFEQVQTLAKHYLGSPEDVADAVLYAVTRPIHVNVAEMVIRPPRQPVV